jgi:chromosome segregation ATPase
VRFELLEADVKRLNLLNGKLRSQLLAEREKHEATLRSLVSSPATSSPDKKVAAAMESSLRHANRQVAKLQSQIKLLEQTDMQPTHDRTASGEHEASGEKVGAFKQFGKRLKADLEAQTERRLQAERDLYEAQDRAAAEMHRLESRLANQEEHIVRTERLLAEADATEARRVAELNRIRAQLQSEMDARAEAEAQRDAITRLSLVQRNATAEEQRWQSLASKAQASLVQMQQQLMHEKQARVLLELEREREMLAKLQLPIPRSSPVPSPEQYHTPLATLGSPTPQFQLPFALASAAQHTLQSLEARLLSEGQRRVAAERERDRALGMLPSPRSDRTDHYLKAHNLETTLDLAWHLPTA